MTPDLPSDPMKYAIDLRFIVGGLSIALALTMEAVVTVAVRIWG
jgi:hypothetical protein